MTQRTVPLVPLTHPLIGLALCAPLGAQVCEVEVIPFDADGNERMGSSLVFDGSRLIAGAPGDLGATAAQILGAAYVYAPTGPGGSWEHQQKLKPASLEQRDRFGTAMDLAGSTLVVGAPGEAGALQFSSGKVYVFDEVAAGQWSEVALLTPSDGNLGDRFGASIALDGDRMIVGAPGHDSAGVNAGAVYVFERVAGSWTEAQKIERPAGVTGPGFGQAVAADAGRVCIGGPSLSVTAPVAGGALMFERDAAGIYQFTQNVQGATIGISDQYGASLALEGGTLLVGAPNDDDAASDAGALYHFEFDAMGGTFVEAAKLLRSGAVNGEDLGESVTIDGDRVLSGGPDLGSGGGAVVFERSGGSPFVEQRIVLPIEAQLASSSAGSAVALAGPIAAFGDPDASPEVFRDGAVYLLDVTLADLDGNGVSDGCENWWQSYCTQTVPNSTGAFAALDAFGSPVAANQTLTLEGSGLPAFQFALLVASQTQDRIPTPGFAQGDLCLGGTIGRFLNEITSANSGGTLLIDVPMGSMPSPLPSAVLAGDTWNFQLWFRDANPGPTANFTDGIQITFL